MQSMLFFSANSCTSKAEKNERLFQSREAVSKDAKRLSIDKSTCIIKYYWQFMVWFRKQKLDHEAKIVLEVVPWVR
jgi:hypothetical protein